MFEKKLKKIFDLNGDKMKIEDFKTELTRVRITKKDASMLLQDFKGQGWLDFNNREVKRKKKHDR